MHRGHDSTGSDQDNTSEHQTVTTGDGQVQTRGHGVELKLAPLDLHSFGRPVLKLAIWRAGSRRKTNLPAPMVSSQKSICNDEADQRPDHEQRDLNVSNPGKDRDKHQKPHGNGVWSRLFRYPL